jgi:hypothetical protein
VFDLASPQGTDAIVEVATMRNRRELIEQIPDCLNLHGRSMWIKLNAPEIHIASWALYEEDMLTYYRRRNDIPDRGKHSPIDQDACKALAKAVSHLLKTEGRGQHCTVETLRRGDIDSYIIHVDDYVQCEHVHDDSGKLGTHSVRSTTQVTFKYIRVEGWMELAAAMKPKAKDQLEQSFSSRIVGGTLPAYQKRRAYQLDHLLDESFQLTTDPVAAGRSPRDGA